MTPVTIVFLLVTTITSAELAPDGSFSSVKITEIPFPKDTTLAEYEANKAPALLDALMSGEVDTNVVLFAAKCEQMVLLPSSGG